MTGTTEAVINVLTYDADQTIIREATDADLAAAADADKYIGTFACPVTGDTVLLDAEMTLSGSYVLPVAHARCGRCWDCPDCDARYCITVADHAHACGQDDLDAVAARPQGSKN